MTDRQGDTSGQGSQPSAQAPSELGDPVSIPIAILEPLLRCPNYPDYPTAWAIQRDRGDKLEHQPRCSSVPGWHPISGPGILCDCGAVAREWKRLAQGIEARGAETIGSACESPVRQDAPNPSQEPST